MPSGAWKLDSVRVSPKIWTKSSRKPPSRTLNIPSFLNVRWNRFLDPVSVPLGFRLDLELNLYIQYVGGENNNHLIVEITDPDHYQNLISCSLAWGWRLQQISWKFVHEFLWHPADIQNRGDNTAFFGRGKNIPADLHFSMKNFITNETFTPKLHLGSILLHICSFRGSVCIYKWVKLIKYKMS